MKNIITFQGNPLSLAGRSLRAGAAAPGFEVTSQDMKSVRLSDFRGKIKLIPTVPSLDTPVCDLRVVPELTKSPDYAAALRALDEVVKDPAVKARCCSFCSCSRGK